MTSTSSTEQSPPPTAGRGRFGLWFILAGTLLVLVWFILRVIGAVGEQKALAEQREQSNQQDSQIHEVELTQAKRTTWKPIARLEGTIEAEQRAQLGFKVGGRLSQVQVRLGDRVRAGQALGQLDTSEALAQKNAAQAQLEATKAQLALAADAERRTAQLVTSGALAEANAVQTEQQRALAEAQMQAAQAQLKLALTQLQNHTLVAPFAGVITRSPSTQGAVIAPGEPLFELVDNSKLRLKGSVSEADSALIQAGSRVLVPTPRGSLIEGKVRAIVSVLDPATRRVPVEADLEASDELRVGSFVRATIENEESLEVWSLPGETLRPGSQNIVLVVQNNQIEERELVFQVDPKTGHLLIQTGLQGDEQVVLSPRPEARQGDPVRIAQGTQTPSPSPEEPQP